MFRISRRLDYGLQLMIALAADTENRPQATAMLSKKLDIPLPFMHQIGHTLMQAGMVKASPGPHGGLRLNRPAESITVLQIIEILEGPVCMNSCLECGSNCPRQSSCTAQYVWGDLQNRITEYLSSIRLSDLSAGTSRLPLYGLGLASEREEDVLSAS